MTPKRLVGLAALALLYAPAPGRALEQVIATVPNQSAISAYGGHVVWSELDPQSRLWYLTDWQGGRVARLPLAPRPVPFDVDVGPDTQGRPTAVYSRCRSEPLPAMPLAPAPDWMTARGCDLYAFSLTEGGNERRLRGPSSRRGSETTPSLWRDALAFARRFPGKRKARIYLRPARGALKRLVGGTLPRCRPARLCPPEPYAGVDELDLGARSLAFLWRLTNGNVFGEVAWELRSDPLSGAGGVIDAVGYVGDCEIDVPQSPNAFGRGALYLERAGGCTVTRSPIASFDPRSGRLREAVPSGLAYSVALDGRTIYWIRGPTPQPNQPPDADACRTAPNACVLVRSRDLRFRRARHRKAAPPLV